MDSILLNANTWGTYFLNLGLKPGALLGVIHESTSQTLVQREL